MYNIAYSTIKDYNKGIKWVNSADAEIQYYENYHPRYILDYDKNTYTYFKTGTQYVYSINLSFNDSITSNCFYMKWNYLQNVDIVILYGSNDGTNWTEIVVDTVNGDVERLGSYEIGILDETDGKMYITFNSNQSWLNYKILFYCIAGFPDTSSLKINSAWFGKQLDIIEMDLDKSYNYSMYGITRNKTFDGEVWTSIYGSEPRAEWELKWSLISNNEKIETESFINELLYNPKILITDLVRINKWYECINDAEELSFNEEQAYLYNYNLTLKEI